MDRLDNEPKESYYDRACTAAPIVGKTDSNILKVILFGSVAKQDYDPTHADIDLAVVFPDHFTHNKACQIIEKAYSRLRKNHIPTGEIPGGITLEPVSIGSVDYPSIDSFQLYQGIQKGITLYEG